MNIYYFDPSLDCSLFFISHSCPPPHYSLSVLDISRAHPLPFKSLSHPALRLHFFSPPTFVFLSLSHKPIFPRLSYFHRFNTPHLSSSRSPSPSSSPSTSSPPSRSEEHWHALQAGALLPVLGEIPGPKGLLEAPESQPSAAPDEQPRQHHHDPAEAHHRRHGRELHLHPAAEKREDGLRCGGCPAAP